MRKKIILLLGVAASAALLFILPPARDLKASDAAKTTPADGYSVHVTAPHNVNGHSMGPYHHFCKVMTSDPVIVCQIYDSDDPNGMMKQVEFIIAKKLTRSTVPLNDWIRLWHDHAVEIATGRVQVLDLPPDKAKDVADLVAHTDGIIYSFEFNGNVPTGKITMAQAVGHRALTATEYEQSKRDAMALAAH